MNRHLYPQIRTIHVLSVIAVFAISAGILLAAQSGCIGATLAGTDGSYDTPDTELSGHAPVQAVTAWEGMSNLIVACQIADTFADMLFTGVLDAAYAVHEVLSLTATSQITDTTDLVLNYAIAIATFESGDHTYAVVVARDDDGIQILNITDPSMITAAGNIINTNELDRAQDIALFESGGHTYAAVTAFFGNAVQILDITDPSMITAAGHIVDTEGTNELLLNGATGITTFVSGDDTYAAVTAKNDRGVQILNITDPYMITAAGSITDTPGSTGLELLDAQGITTFVSGNDTYAAVAASADHGVQILNITDPYMITAAGNITDTSGSTGLELNGAYGITTFVSGNYTYAAVAAFLDDGVQILNITDPYMITAAGSIRDTSGSTGLALDNARRITTFESGGHIYAAVASFNDNGIQILDVTDPPNIVPAGSITDDGTNTDILELNGAQGITTFESGGHIYAAVASSRDDGVQIIRIDIPPDTTLPADAFVTTWKTESADQSITINFVGSGMNISWGDGTTETNLSGPQTHIYTKAGNYTVSVTGGLTGLTLDRSPNSFGLPGFVPELASIDQWGDTRWTTMHEAFYGARNMVYNATDTPDLSGVTDMSGMFGDARAFNGDLSSWDVSSVTDMSGMFGGASSFNQTLSSWDVSSVTDMTFMFIGASSFNQPLNSWNVSSVRDMSSMFYEATDFNQPLNAWNVSKVTSMASMFAGATSFNQPLNDWDVSSVIYMSSMFFSATSFDGTLSDWNVSSVTNMNEMFFDAEAFNQPLNDWNVSKVTSMEDMFAGATAFDQDLANWYVVQDLPPVLTANATLSIRAQNSYLDGLVSTYSINDTRFVMDGKTLSLNSTNLPPAGMHSLDITAPAVLGEPNADTHTRTVTITVSDPPAIPFITMWKTTSADESITLPLVGTDITINWGDGSTTAGVSTPVDHTYNTAGNYTVQITGGLERFHLDGLQPNAGRLISIDQWGDIRWTSMSGAFDGASNMVYNATDAPDLSGVTDMSYMFFGASSFNGDLSSWDVSKVTNMESMFRSAFSFNQPLNDWDVSAVTDMSSMFDSATAFDGDLSSWDVSAVTNMNRMFHTASSFNQTISSWDVSAVTDMLRMFYEASDFNQPLNDWDVSSVSEMGSMFYQAADFNQPLNAWDVSSVTDMSDMFNFATSFNQPLNSWDVSKVTGMFGMFSSASSFNQTLNSWDVSSVTDMSYMFFGASSFDQPLNNWNVSSVTDMTGMFEGASSFNQPLNNWNVSSVIGVGMIFMFHNADDFDQNLGNWYVVANATSIARADVPRVVAEISAQNDHLNGHNLTYGIGGDNDYAFFEIVNDNKINMTSVGTKSSYRVNVTASGSNVFESGNNWRLLEITVRDSTNTDSAPPAFVSSILDMATGNLTITFSEEIDAANVVPASIHMRESGTYTGGVTLTATELVTIADGTVISFALNVAHLEAVAAMTEPELTIDPGAVQDTSGRLIVSTFEASTATFVDAFSVSLQDATPADITFSNDGAKMFMIGRSGDAVYEYALSTPFDVSTATFVDSFSVLLQESGSTGIAFSSDGAKMFVVGSGGDAVHEYELSTPFDASTATFVDSFSVSVQDIVPTGMAFSSDGAKMFVVGSRGDAVHEYALSTPFDASTAAFVYTFSVSSRSSNPQGMAFSSDGAKMFVIDNGRDTVIEYEMSTPFDASTAAFVDATSIRSQVDSPTGIAFSSDGAKMFVTGSISDSVHEYDLSSAYPIEVTGTYVSPPPTFVSSILGMATGSLAITFSDEIDAANVVPAKIHVRESGTYAGGVTLTVTELDTAADGIVISFTLNVTHFEAVAAMTAPELTIDPGAVRDTYGSLIVGTFEASTATFVDATSISSQETFPTGIAFSSDGARMFVIGITGDAVYEYALSTPFDASTRTWVDDTSISSQESNPQGIAFSSDGTRMFVIGYAGDDVNEYALSTPFDASTRTFVDATSISLQENKPTGIAFSSDGAKMFVVGDAGDDVNEYELSTPFDASTRTWVDATSISSQESTPTGIAFSSDGTRMFVIDDAGDDVNEYELSTPFDASTRTFVDATSISEQEDNPQGIAFSSDGAKMFVIGWQKDAVIEYDLSSVYQIAVAGTYVPPPPTFVSSILDMATGNLTITFSDEIDAANIVPAKIHVRESGNYTHGVTLTVTELGTTANGTVISFTLNIAHLEAVAAMTAPELTIDPGAVRDTSGSLIVGTFDASTASFVTVTSISLQETTPTGIAFSSDGAKMFVIGIIGDDVNEYALSTPFDVSTRTFVDATSIQSQETFPTGIAFSSDGTKMFVIGDTGDDVNEYELSTPFDASTLTFVDATQISEQETGPTGIAFSSDGAKMFVIGRTGDDVNEYALSTPFDASTASFVDATQISEQETNPRGIAFSSDGAKMFVVGNTGEDVNEYNLSTPFDVSTRTWVDATSISEQETFPTGIAFSSDGTKMFVVGDTGDDVNEYALSSVYPIAVTGPPAGAFVTTWRTTSADESITLPLVGTDITINWGDGSTTAGVSTPVDHTYNTAGDYTVQITGGLERFHLDGLQPNAGRLISIDQWGDTRWTTMDAAFDGATNMVYRATDTPDLGLVSDMSRMFAGAAAFDGDLSSWDVSKVTNMESMFRGASSFNQPLNNWNVSSVTDMTGMFYYASSFNQPLNSWDVSSVSDMGSMFYEVTDFNQPLNTWDVSSVTDMAEMFSGASSFNQPLNSWDVSKVTNMDLMFRSASSFNQPLNSWNVSSVRDMVSMFFSATSFDGTLSDWNVSSVSDMFGMFSSASSFNQPLNNWNVSSVTDMTGMFSGASSFNQTLNAWDVSKVTDMRDMFYQATDFNQPLNAWDVSSVTYMIDMFDFATAFSQNLGEWYVTLDPDTIAGTGIPGVVGTISAQNQPLKNHSPTYVIVDGLDKNHFEIAPGNQLNMTSGVSGKAEYSVNVTASGGSVFESGNNWRLLEIKVTGQTTDTTPPVIKLEGSSLVTITVDDTYTEQGAVCDDNVDADKPATVGGDTVDTSTVGQYTVTYDCTDSSNNEATQVSRTVNVQSAPDTDAPVIIITGLTNIQLTVDETYTEQGAVCEDNVDADKAATVGGDTVDTSTVGQYTVTYDCTDSSNNEATQVSRTVNVQSAPDTDAPVIIITGSANIQLTVDETYTEQGAVCEDNVDADKPATVGGDTVDTSTVGQYTVTYDCTDSSNNEATQVSRTVNVQSAPDTDAPVIIITGLTNIQLTVDETYTEQGAVCEDNVDADKPATVGGDTVDTSTVGQYTVTYDCTDSSNNEATQVSRTVNVQSAPDTDAPVIIITGLTNIQLTVDETYTEQGAVCDDDVDADKPATVGGDTVDTSTAGQYTVTYDCTDSSNNEATQVSRTVNVQSAPDTDAPVIIITGLTNIQLTVDETYTEQGAVCEDNVDADKPATVGGDTVDTSTVGQYTVTYDCTDSSNNEATQVSRTVNVQSAPDTDAPVIIITGLTNIQLTVDETYTEQGAVCEDNVDADKPATVGGDTVDTSTAGQYTVTYDCTDSSNNEATQVSRTVNVQSAPDTDAPVIIITGLTNIQLTVDETYTEQGAVCEDNVDADKPATVGGDTVDTSTAGQYTVTYDCTDSSNNEATQVSRTVNVQSAPDTDAPVIIITGLTNIQLTVDETYTEQGAVCEDNVDADKPATVGGDTVDTSTAGQYTVTYDCTDSSNNEATQVSRTVNVQSAPDTDAPVIIITGLTNIQLTVDETYTEQGAVCEDNVDADKAATVGGDTVDTSTVGQYTVTYDCTDSSNNEATQVSRTVNVQSAPDTDAPVIIITGLTNIQLTVDETYTEQGAVCEDNVDADKAATVGGDTVDTSTVGQYTVTYDCTDSSNNEATQVSRTVNVQSAPDTDAPVIIITGLTNIQLTVDETYTEQGAVCEDNVDADKAATVGGDTVDTSTVGQYTVTYDCTDSSNNEATQVSRTVNVQSAPDTDAPVIIITGLTNIQLTVDETYTEQGAVCEDNVDADKAATVGGDTVDTSTVGQYTVTYDCTDSSNNEATQVSRTVNVQSAPDTDAPVIIITGLTNIQLTVDETYTEQGAVCEDNVDADKPATVGGDTVDTSTAGQYTVTYDCTDSSNNEATQVSRTVNVQSAPDTDAPVIIITGLTNIQLTVDETYTEQGAVCEDNVDADKPATVGGDTVDTSTVGQYTVTYDCTDSSNNEATQVSRTVIVQTAVTPRITLSADAFITTWRTDSANQTITIPVGGSTARYSIDWGDNSPAETDITGDSTHTYREADSYTVSISGGLERFHLDGQQPNAGMLASIEQWGDTRWTTMDAAFDGATNMVYRATDTPDLSGVTDMHRMFGDASFFNGDLSSWDVSKVTDMSDMFIFAYDFNGDLSSWDVSSVTNMNEMFAVATSFNQPLNDWDVSSVTYMSGMFYYAYDFNQPLNSWDVSSVTNMNDMFAVATSFNQPLNDWDVSSVTYMSGMFEDATDFNQPLNSWNVSRVTNMDDMFNFATAFSQNLGEWYVVQDPPVLTANAMFPIRAQNSYLDGLVSTYSIDDTRFVMDGKTLSLNSTNLPPVGMYPLDITAPAVLGEPNAEEEGHTRTLIVTVKGEHRPFITTWTATDSDKSITLPMKGMYSILWGDGSNSTNVSDFQSHTYSTAGNYTVTVLGDGLKSISLYDPNDIPNALQLKSIDQWGDTRWTTMNRAFDGATNMVYRATDAPDLSDVDYTGYMFYGTSSFNGNLSSWDVSSVTHMEYMFASTSSFNGDLSSWDVSSVTDMSGMFFFASVFNHPLNDWDVSSVTEMDDMFYQATDFNQPLNDWDVSSVTDIGGMFSRATNFNQPLNDWNVSSVTDMNDMFAGATSFNQPLNSWNVSKVSRMVEMFANTPSFQQNLGNWYVVANATSIARADVPGVVAEISAQNDYLNDHNPTYGISRDNDYAFFEIVNGNKINMTSVGTKSSYMVNVTASGSNVFEDGNNWRVLAVSVSAALSDNADLGGLTISSGTLSPQFSSSDIAYTASVDNSVTQVTVTPTVSDSSAAITVNDNTVTSGNGYIVTSLTVGEPTTVTVIVTAQDSTTKTYTITLTRAASLSGNADLGGLTISSGTLSPQFSSSDITYTASVDNSVTQVTVTPTVSDSSAAITVNDNTVTSGTGHIVIGLTVGEPTTVTVIVTAQDSTTKTYTITLTRAASLSGNADLGGLTISSGTLSPQFSSSVITYTASVDNSVTQVTVTPTASDSSAAITVNGNTVTSGTGHIVIGLIAGEPNTVTVIVTAQDSTTKTYTITLTRAASLSDNADLGGLTISSGTLSPQFSSSDITYTASVDNSVTQVTVTPTASDSSAAITVNGNTVTSGTGHIVIGLIAGEPNTVTVIVTAQDSTTKTYTITLTRAASLSDNADLGGLTISSGTLSPQFSSSDITYTASVDNSVTQVTVTPTASDSSAAITVNGNTVTSGTGHIVTSLTVGEPNTVTVIVTAQDSTTKTYTITLTRAASLSGNADLGGLTISSGTLSPQFSSSDITYTASVDNSVTQVTVTPTASDSSAAITVNGNDVISGTGHIVTSLTVGEPNTVTVIVTAQDSTTKTYTITLTRAASLSDNADLGSLTISSGTLSPQFSSSDITYTASVDNSVTQVTVTPTASDSSATITVNGNTVTSGNGYIVTSLTVGEPNTVTVIVTAQDSTTKTYTITLTRAASLSDNADLGSLTISSGTLSPQFSSSDITYTASVDNSVTQVTVTPTASDSSAAITVNGNTVTSGNGYIVTSLTVGEPNTVTVIVTAQDSTTKTYIITLTRAASLSDNADLGSLTISSGTLSPQFSSSDITYTASVDNSVTQVTVTPTASDSSAAITVNGNTVISGNGYIVTSLTVGEPTTVTVIVTAQDSTTKTYIITLTRAAPLSGNADLGSLTISSGTLSPQFSSSDITYTASVDNSVTQVTVTPTASDSLAAITVNGNTVTSGNGYIVTSLTVGEPTTVTVIVTAQDSTTKTYIITVTVRDVPITVSSAAYNPGNGQLTITFNQDIATVDYSRLHVRSSANPDTGGITLSSVTGADYSGRTITATLDSEQQDQYDALQSPHLVVEDGAVTDTDGDQTTDVPPQPIRDASQKGSSSSSKASIVHINALAQSRLVDIPSHIAEQVESHDASDPLEPITPDGTFDLPLVINGYGYLLDAYENTLISQTVTAGDNPVHITFTVYTEKEFAHFILYLNLQGRNTNYADSDTYITYKDDGTTSITDPHGYIGSATVTVTQEDDQIPEKRTVRITIEFGEEPMGPTNMVAYMWNTDREALFVKIIDALEVVAASPESAMQAADPEPLEPDSVLPADPEPVTPDFADDAADPEPVPYDILGPDDYDDTQILQIIRMWSGFESESITDAQLLELLGLDDHQGADIPDWMMTELGVLVAKGTVTVDEFLVALQYVLEHV